MELIPDFVDRLLAKLMAGEYRRLEQMYLALTQRNNRLLGRTSNGFRLSDRLYITKALPPTGDKPLLHPELLMEAAAMIHAEDVVVEDRNRLTQILNLLYEPCQTFEALGATSPACFKNYLGPAIGEHAGRDPGFTLRGNPRHWRQFQALLPKIEMMAATSLIY